MDEKQRESNKVFGNGPFRDKRRNVQSCKWSQYRGDDRETNTSCGKVGGKEDEN